MGKLQIREFQRPPARFEDTLARHLAKNWLFLLSLSHSVPSLPTFPLKIRAEVNHEETRFMGLSYSEDSMNLLSRFDTVPACVGRTDRQADGFTIASTALCIASYADALQKPQTIYFMLYK